MEILRIPTHYTTQITYMSTEDKAYIFEVIMRMSIWEQLELEKSMRWWIALSIFTEAVQLENKASAKKWKSLKIDIAPMVQPMGQSKINNDATKSNQIKSKQVKSSQSNTNQELSKDNEQSSTELVIKEDKRVLEIDLVLEALKNCNMWLLDDTVKKQRQYWKLIKDKLNTLKWFNWDYAWFITYAYEHSDEYRKNHFRSAEKFYYNLANIIAWIKIQAEKKPVRRWC